MRNFLILFLGISIKNSLQFRISIAVYQRIQLLSLLTEWTLAKIKCLIIRKFPFGVNTVNRNPVHLIHSCKNGRNPLQYTAVILNTFHSLCNGFSCSHHCKKKKDILSLNHRLQIIPKDHLTVTVKFRTDHINCLVGISGHHSCLGQLICQISAYHLHSFQTNNRIYYCVVHISSNQSSGRFPGFTLP